jgi:hypothetical protein
LVLGSCAYPVAQRIKKQTVPDMTANIFFRRLLVRRIISSSFFPIEDWNDWNGWNY